MRTATTMTTTNGQRARSGGTITFPSAVRSLSFETQSDADGLYAVAVALLLMPHPSLLHVFIHYHLLTLNSPLQFGIHLIVTYTLTFLAFCSLIVCVARDPGPVPDPKQAAHEPDDEMSLEDALMAPPPEDDYMLPGRWCRICWAPKPERAHHCSQCGRCVLKMGASCIPVWPVYIV